MDSCCLGASGGHGVAVIVMTVATAWIKCCVLWHVLYMAVDPDGLEWTEVEWSGVEWTAGLARTSCSS